MELLGISFGLGMLQKITEKLGAMNQDSLGTCALKY